MKDRETQAGYDLESAYWTGNLYEVEDELEELDTLERNSLLREQLFGLGAMTEDTVADFFAALDNSFDL